MSSILAFAAIFLALSVRFLKMIWSRGERKSSCIMTGAFNEGHEGRSHRFVVDWRQNDGFLDGSDHNLP
jgi:hypothetical protein